MKKNLVLFSAIALLLVVVFFMVKDFFNKKNISQENPYELKLDNLKKIDTSLICYSEISQIKPDIEILHSIAIDKNDRIYLAGKDKVLIYDAKGNLETTIKTNVEANCIGVGVENEIYLGAQNHIEIWTSKGEKQKVWNSVNDKSVLTSIAVGETSIFVADAGNRVVYQYDKSGKLINEIGKKNTEKGILGFVIPSPYFDLLIGREGELWVVNPGRHSLESYKENGDLVSSWSKASMGLDGFCGCCNPSNIAMLSDGSFVTSEKAIERVKIHQPTGEFKCVVAGPDKFVEGTKGIDLAVDSKDRIYVLDPVKKVVSVFIKK